MVFVFSKLSLAKVMLKKTSATSGVMCGSLLLFFSQQTAVACYVIVCSARLCLLLCWFLFCKSLSHVNCHSHCAAYHRVVANAEEAHHLYVCRN